MLKAIKNIDSELAVWVIRKQCPLLADPDGGGGRLKGGDCGWRRACSRLLGLGRGGTASRVVGAAGVFGTTDEADMLAGIDGWYIGGVL